VRDVLLEVDVEVNGGGRMTGVGEFINGVGEEKSGGGGVYCNGSTTQPEQPDRNIVSAAQKKRKRFITDSFVYFDFICSPV
jgi:hypothetical protein